MITGAPSMRISCRGLEKLSGVVMRAAAGMRACLTGGGCDGLMNSFEEPGSTSGSCTSPVDALRDKDASGRVQSSVGNTGSGRTPASAIKAKEEVQ